MAYACSLEPFPSKRLVFVHQTNFNERTQIPRKRRLRFPWLDQETSRKMGEKFSQEILRTKLPAQRRTTWLKVQINSCAATAEKKSSQFLRKGRGLITNSSLSVLIVRVQRSSSRRNQRSKLSSERIAKASFATSATRTKLPAQ